MLTPGELARRSRRSSWLLALLVLTGCIGGPHGPAEVRGGRHAPSTPAAMPAPVATSVPAAPVLRQFRHLLHGMPAPARNDVYALAGAGALAARVRHDPALVYVPDSSPGGTTVTVISQRTHKVVRTLRVGHLTQHVTPSYDLRRLYASSSESNELVVIDPRTARVIRRISTPRPYNLYFTPDGSQSVLMEEENDTIRFAHPRSFGKEDDVRARGCHGPNHADFSANGRFLVVSCEFSGLLVKLGTTSHRVLARLRLPAGSMPQDVRVSPDGSRFYVADMGTDRVRVISAAGLRQVRAIRTPHQPHGIYPSRDGRRLFVSDRGAGRVTVLSTRTDRVLATWRIPGGGSPDMGGVSADGRTLWLSGRYDGEVYAIDTRTGSLTDRIAVPGDPHGLCVWPQPGRYSLGHTGNLR